MGLKSRLKSNESIVQCGREVTAQELSVIKETVKMFPRLSRTELSVTVSEHLEWFTASGSPKIDACMNLLIKLEEQGHIVLPDLDPANRGPRPAKTTSTIAPQNVESASHPEITGTVKDVGPVEIKWVLAKQDQEVFNGYLASYHYLGYKKPFGFTGRYIIDSPHGVLGCILLAGPARAIGSRDKWIGWDPQQRLANLPWVVNNSRFLILPWVNVKNLASYALGRVARLVGTDWQQRWGYRPVLLETFVDPRRYEGTCYLAANWQYLGMTTGEGLVRSGKTYSTTAKKVFVYPLKKDFRKILCSKQTIRPIDA